MVATLNDLGVVFEKPKGAMYVWCAYPEGWNSEDFTMALLEQAGVSVAPGMMFGKLGEGYIRISLCLPKERLQEAMQRLTVWWRENLN